jgi:hypothetical protein
VSNLAALRTLLTDGNALSKSRAESLKVAIRRGKLCIGTDYVLGRLDACRAAPNPTEAAQIAALALSKAAQKNIALAPCLKAALEALKGSA